MDYPWLLINFKIFWAFFKIAVLSFGGFYAVAPEIERVVVWENHWISEEQFLQAYVLGLFVPGPNLAIGPLIGYWVNGVWGWIAAFMGIYVFPLVLLDICFSAYQRYRSSTLLKMLQTSLRPVVLGFLCSTMLHLWFAQASANYLLALVLFAAAAAAYVFFQLKPLVLLFIFSTTWACCLEPARVLGFILRFI